MAELKPREEKAEVVSRNTRQKDAIRRALVEAGRPLSPEEVLMAAGQLADSVSIATVYRNLAALVKEGWLLAVELPGMPARYEVAGKAHHHHFHCNSCGKVYELEGCVLESVPRLPKGFRATAHEYFFSGECASCR